MEEIGDADFEVRMTKSAKDWMHGRQYTIGRNKSAQLGQYLSAFERIGKGKGHPCTGTEALYRPYGP